MVRAILNGTKTQTRRIVKDQPPEGHHIDTCHYNDTGWAHWRTGVGVDSGTCKCNNVRAPFGHAGDRLWVRETFALEATDKLYPWHLDGRSHQQGDDREEFSITVPHYRATDDDYGLTTEEQFDNGDTRTRWKPSLFMPRWASRITLEVVIVRVERLNAISEADAVAEGIPAFPSSPSNIPAMQYQSLWESINGPGSWEKNPWVWVIEFRVLPTNTTEG